MERTCTGVLSIQTIRLLHEISPNTRRLNTMLRSIIIIGITIVRSMMGMPNARLDTMVSQLVGRWMSNRGRYHFKKSPQSLDSSSSAGEGPARAVAVGRDAVKPTSSTAEMIARTPIFSELYTTRARSVARLTTTSSTPSVDLSMLSMMPTQDEHVIPPITSVTSCTVCLLGTAGRSSDD